MSKQKAKKNIIEIKEKQKKLQEYEDKLVILQKEIKEITVLNLKNKFNGKLFKKEDKENTIYVECFDVLEPEIAIGNLCAIRKNVPDEGIMLNQNVKFKLKVCEEEITKDEYIKGIIEITDSLKEKIYGNKKVK